MDKKPNAGAPGLPHELKSEAKGIEARLKSRPSEEMPIDEAQLIAQSLDAIPDMMLPCPLYVQWHGKFRVLFQRGERLTPERKAELEELGIPALHLNEMYQMVFMAAVEKVAPRESETPESAMKQVRRLIGSLGDVMEHRTTGTGNPVFGKVAKLAHALSDSLDTQPTIARNLLTRSPDPETYFRNHLVNTAVYANLIAQNLNFPNADLRMMTCAIALHDIGDLFMPKAILQKKGEVTLEEMEKLKQHPRLGANLLISMRLPGPIVQTVMQHHEKMDGKGYPEGRSGSDIHPFARICSIADVYDALITDRPFRPALTPEKAIETMGKMRGHFDPEFLEIARVALRPH